MITNWAIVNKFSSLTTLATRDLGTRCVREASGGFCWLLWHWLLALMSRLRFVLAFAVLAFELNISIIRFIDFTSLSDSVYSFKLMEYFVGWYLHDDSLYNFRVMWLFVRWHLHEYIDIETWSLSSFSTLGNHLY